MRQLTIERMLEEESYWFSYRGTVDGHVTEDGHLSYTVSEFLDALPQVPRSAWKIGKRNPGFGGSDLDRSAFLQAFETVERLLDSWNCADDDAVGACALKSLNITSRAVRAITAALSSIERVHHLAEIDVMRYWYCPDWPGPRFDPDLVLHEFSIRIPLQFRLSLEEKLVAVEVMAQAFC